MENQNALLRKTQQQNKGRKMLNVDQFNFATGRIYETAQRIEVRVLHIDDDPIAICEVWFQDKSRGITGFYILDDIDIEYLTDESLFPTQISKREELERITLSKYDNGNYQLDNLNGKEIF